MSYSEQADIPFEQSSEQLDTTKLLQRMYADIDAAGSVKEYVYLLGSGYLHSRQDRPNMLQLQRIARQTVNPNDEASFNHRNTEAFYWGEMLAYRFQELIQGEGWAQSAYALFNEKFTKSQQEFAEVSDVSIRQRREMVAATRLGELEDVSEYVPDEMDTYVITIADQLVETQAQESYLLLGFRHVTEQVFRAAEYGELKAMVDDVFLENVKSHLRHVAVSQEVEVVFDEGPETESVDDVTAHLLEKFDGLTGSLTERRLKTEPEFDAFMEALHLAMNTELEATEGLDRGEYVKVSGSALCIFVDQANGSQHHVVLGEHDVIQGVVESLAIAAMPESDIRRIAEDVSGGTDELGLLMVLNEVTYLKNFHYETIPESVAVGVVLNTATAHIEKFLD